MSPTPMSLVLLGLVSFGSWFVSLMAGGGSPLLLLPMVNGILGSEAVAPVVTVGLLLGNVQRSLFFWRAIDWRPTVWYLPGAIGGAILGAWLFTMVRLGSLQGYLGLGLLAMALHFGVRYYWPKPMTGVTQPGWVVRDWHFLPLAFLNAIASTLIGSTGPMLNPLYLNYGLTKEDLIATKAIHNIALHLIKLLAYLGLGRLTMQEIGYGCLIGLAGIPANWLGKQVLARVSSEQFKIWVYVLVGVSGALMVWRTIPVAHAGIG